MAVASCVWRVRPELLLALDRRFGEPDDAYVNGAQIWQRPDGPAGELIEYRLHPRAGYVRPRGIATDEVFAHTVYALSTEATDEATDEATMIHWDGLEAYELFGADLEPAVLRAITTEALALAPDAYGLVEHEPIADAWERAQGDYSVIEAVLAQLGAVGS